MIIDVDKRLKAAKAYYEDEEKMTIYSVSPWNYWPVVEYGWWRAMLLTFFSRKSAQDVKYDLFHTRERKRGPDLDIVGIVTLDGLEIRSPFASTPRPWRPDNDTCAGATTR